MDEWNWSSNDSTCNISAHVVLWSLNMTWPLFNDVSDESYTFCLSSTWLQQIITCKTWDFLKKSTCCVICWKGNQFFNTIVVPYWYILPSMESYFLVMLIKHKNYWLSYLCISTQKMTSQLPNCFNKFIIQTEIDQVP